MSYFSTIKKRYFCKSNPVKAKPSPTAVFTYYILELNLIMKNIYMQVVGPRFIKNILTPKISFIFLFSFAFIISCVAQTATDGDFRTRASGMWNGAGTWQLRTAGTWANTATQPTSTSNIYIQNGHTLTINAATVDCNDLQINLGGIVSIGTNILQVSGKLRAYSGSAVIGAGADGSFYSGQASSSAPVNAMLSTSGGGLLRFVGGTRNITNTNQWANTAGTTHATEFALAAGATGTLQTGYKSLSILITSGIIDMTGAFRLAIDNGTTGQGDCTIQSGATFISSATGGLGNSVMSATGTASTGRAGTLTLNGKLVLSGASPEIQFTTVNLNPGSTVEYSKASGQSFLSSTFTGAAAINSYGSLILSGSGNKTPAANFTVLKDITISGAAVLPLGALTLLVGGNWTSYGTAGLTENISTVDFNGTGAQVINTTGGEDFFKLKKSGPGTLTLNSAARLAGTSSELNISAGILDAGTNTLSGTASTAFIMSAGTLKLGKLSTTLPEMTIGTFTLSGASTIELNGAGTQVLQGGRDYRNLTFSTSGTKTVTSAPSSITGTVAIANTAVLDVANNSFGNGSTNLTMTETSKFINGGAGVKPDIAGTYTLGNVGSGTTIEFSLNSATEIRIAPSYFNVIVSGTNVSLSTTTGSVKFQPGGTFTVKNGGIFKVINTNGFSGTASTAIDNTNTPTIILEGGTPGSTIEYNGADQPITNQVINTPANANYVNLALSGASLTNKTAPAGVLTIKGNLTKSGNTFFVNNNGTVVFNGTGTQAYNSTTPVVDFYNLTNNNTVDLTINNDLTITNELAFAANAKLNLEDGNITLRSNATNTANIGQLTGTAGITYSAAGRFIVERYIPTGIAHLKSWQFLAAPTSGQTVRESWMENGLITSTPNSYGTWVTGPGSGFDAATSTPSMKTYVPASDSWVSVGDPSVTQIHNTNGYMVFVRGDRSVFNFSGANSTAVPTTLRTKGTLHIGSQSAIVLADQFESIANPYASAIDLTQLVLNESGSGVQDVFYVWDPKLTSIGLNSVYGLGGFQTLTRNGSSYDVTPGGGSYGATNKLIQSGQAFFAHAVGANGTVRISEGSKVSGSSIVTRHADNLNNTTEGRQLRTNLYAIKDGVPVMIDGNRVQFAAGNSNKVDMFDAIKMNNSGEDLGLKRNAKNLVVERRALIDRADTIFYKTGQLKMQQYQLEFIPTGIARPGLHAFLEDKFLGTRTEIDLTITSRISFNVNNAEASRTAGRFRLIFKQKNHPENPGNKDLLEQNNISVYPNPVTDKTIRLSFKDQAAGKYLLQLSNQSGQVVLEQNVSVSGNNFTRSIPASNVPAGNYELIIVAADGKKTVVQLIIR